MEYRHTQTALQSVLLTVGLVAALLILLMPSLDEAGLLIPIGTVSVVTAAITLVFSRLTVTVGDGEVVAAFGVGWPRHVERVDEIVSVEAVRNKWIYGWGMRRIPDGWMYNVWGLDAVEVVTASGRKFRIGTDDPEGLLGALTAATSTR